MVLLTPNLTKLSYYVLLLINVILAFVFYQIKSDILDDTFKLW